MSFTRSASTPLSKDEWNELKALKEAINYDPSQVSPIKMEKFTDLLVRSWMYLQEK
jgi:hypothetical protein